MVQPPALAAFCDDLLDSGGFEDYCPNGLQIEGMKPVRRIATGVTASLALIQAAAEWDADALLVHHGYFWRGEAQPLTGMKGQRIRAIVDSLPPRHSATVFRRMRMRPRRLALTRPGPPARVGPS